MPGKESKSNAGLAILLVCLVALGGCAGISRQPDTHVVRKGDTLYAIAFRYGLDYKSLARRNSINPPYVIYINQLIQLRGAAKQPDKDSGPLIRGASRKGTSESRPSSKPVKAWHWPLKGEVIGSFSLVRPVNKGIDIAGEKGQKVVAAADGIVVYAGGNLRGYGQLVIIKHNDSYLSAYGNNATMLVKEGQSVKAGKSIARVGASPANVGMLHFEIRRDGKPVNPLKHLPAADF